MNKDSSGILNYWGGIGKDSYYQAMEFNFKDNAKYIHEGDNIEVDKIVTDSMSQQDRKRTGLY